MSDSTIVEDGEVSMQGDLNGFEQRSAVHYYEKLQSSTAIRLLKLNRTNLSSEQGSVRAVTPVFDLLEVDLDSTYPEYTCISYVWGTTILDKPVHLKDGTVIRTSPSAFDIIGHYGEDEYIWIDQLSINQADTEERSAQVQLMARIYSQCTRCDAWLGNEDQYSSDAIDLARELGRAFPDSFRLPRLHALNSYPLDYVRGCLALQSPPVHLPDLEDRRWPALARFLNRPWFSRLWTLQEAARPKRIVFRCGLENVELMELHIAACVMGSEHPWDPQNQLTHWQTGTVVRARLELQPKQIDVNRDLVDILSTVQGGGYQCFDQHDRIYAVLGLQRDEVKVPITVDYRFSVPDLLINVTETLIERSRLLHVLGQKSDSGGTIRECLPGWVLDWDPTIGMKAIERTDSAHLRFRASQQRKHCPNPTRHPRQSGELVIAGRICDTVTKVLDLSFDENWNTAKKTVWVIDEILPALLKVCRAETIPEQKEAKRKIIHTITLDVFSEHKSTSGGQRWSSVIVNDRLDGLAYASRNVAFGSGIEPDGIPIAFPVEIKEWLRHLASELKSSCQNRRLVALREHGFGLCPESVVEGDVIAILHGLSVPAVLRPIGERHVFVGPCFVDGMMYGEQCMWSEDDADVLVL